jgi:phosphatidylserine/phosphatidylglycerophosphate/cardiolipin synthase-like enzyme
MILKLLELFGAAKYSNQLHVAEYATHEKMLVIDAEVVVFGSANWLSNRSTKTLSAEGCNVYNRYQC